MNDAVYELSGVRQRLGPVFCLSIDRLGVQSGEVLALLGPTGAGKTTMLRLLAGVERPVHGTISFKAAPLAEVPRARLRAIAMVHQRPILLNRSVEANVAFGLRARGRPTESPVQSMLNYLELSHLARRNAAALSGGQTQLVALARALVVEPEVLLLDEPTANLDPAFVSIVERVIAEIRDRRKMTVVWATHNLFQARRVADRVALLLDGSIVEAAPTEQFFEHPADPRTAAFIQGKMVY